MLKTLEEKQKWVRENRRRNYIDSCRLEGIEFPDEMSCLTKDEIIKKYQQIDIDNSCGNRLY
jgi:hypothetical protein